MNPATVSSGWRGRPPASISPEASPVTSASSPPHAVRSPWSVPRVELYVLLVRRPASVRRAADGAEGRPASPLRWAQASFARLTPPREDGVGRCGDEGIFGRGGASFRVGSTPPLPNHLVYDPLNCWRQKKYSQRVLSCVHPWSVVENQRVCLTTATG